MYEIERKEFARTIFSESPVTSLILKPHDQHSVIWIDSKHAVNAMSVFVTNTSKLHVNSIKGSKLFKCIKKHTLVKLCHFSRNPHFLCIKYLNTKGLFILKHTVKPGREF